MNCQEALSLLYDIIDKEASDIDARQVQEHLSKCRHCSEIYRVEESVNELVRAKLQTTNDNPKNVDSLKAKVLGELDAIDTELRRSAVDNPSSSERSPFFRIGRYFAAAAALILVVGAIYYGSRLQNHHEIYIPLETAHWQAAEDLDSFRNTSATTALIGSLDKYLKYQMAYEVGSFIMIGGHTEEIDGVRMGHFVYHNDDKTVSVFVVDKNLMSVPEELADAMVEHNGINFFDHNCRGCRLVYHEIGNVLVVTATTAKDVELLDFIPGHRVI